MSEDNGAAPGAAEPTVAPEATATPKPIDTHVPTPEETKEQKAKTVSDAIDAAEKKVREKADADEKKASEKPVKKPDEPEKQEPKAKESEKRTETEEKQPEKKPEKAEVEQQRAAEGNEPEKRETAHRDAPKRFDDAAKAEWEKVPESVRGAVHRAVREMEGGIEEYQQEYGPLKEYSDMAKQHGTSIKDALDRYTGLEKLLSSNDPQEKLKGINEVLGYAGINPHQMASAILGREPNQMATQQAQLIQQLQRDNAAMKQQLDGVQKERKTEAEARIQKDIQTFAEAHPRFSELEGTMARFIQSGIASDLSEAYEMADRLKPAVDASAQTRSNPPTIQQQPEDQTLAGSKSVAGAPSSTASKAKHKSASVDEALDRAIKRIG